MVVYSSGSSEETGSGYRSGTCSREAGRLWTGINAFVFPALNLEQILASKHNLLKSKAK